MSQPVVIPDEYATIDETVSRNLPMFLDVRRRLISKLTDDLSNLAVRDYWLVWNNVVVYRA